MSKSPLPAFATLGEALKYLRRRARLTQRELSIAVGFSDSQISRLEQNERKIDAATLLAIFVPALAIEDEPELIRHLLALAQTQPTPAEDDAKAVLHPVFTATAHHPQPLRTEHGKSLVASSLTNLPSRLTSFIGREEAISALSELIATSHLVTLTGVGGVGKTSLAQRVASRILPKFADGVWWVELAPLFAADLLPQAIAAVFKMAVPNQRTYLEALIDYFQERHLLLILDNCEHLIDASAGVVNLLLHACPRLHILVTSRERLSVDSEQEWPLLPLAAPMQIFEVEAITAEQALRQYESVRLFFDRARAIQPLFIWDDENAARVAAICRWLDGIPLAIELAAARLRGITVDELADRLDDRFRLLSVARRPGMARHHTLRAAVDWSYALLSDAEQALLRRLSVFAGGWDLAAVEAIAELHTSNKSPIDNPVDLLLQLVNKSLVVAEPHGRDTRYGMLQTIRQYTGEKLQELHEATLIEAGHFNYYLALAELSNGWRLPWRRPQLQSIESELDNFRAALTWSREQTDNGELFLKLAVALCHFWTNRGADREGQAWLDAAIAACSEAPLPLRATALYELSGLLCQTNLLERRVALAEEALDLCRQCADSAGTAYCHYLLAEIALEQSDFPRALKLFDRALPLLRETRWTIQEGYCLKGMGAALQQMGNADLAISIMEQCLSLARATNALTLLPTALNGLLELNFERGRELCEQELERLRRLNDRELLAAVLQEFGRELIKSDEPFDCDKGIQLMKECLALWRAAGMKWSQAGGTARANLHLGIAYARKGEHSIVMDFASEALRLYQEVGDIPGVAWAHVNIASSALALGDLATAQSRFRSGLKLAPESNHIPYALLGLAEIALQHNDLTRAGQLFGTLVRFLDHKDYMLPAIKELPIMRRAYSNLDDPAFATAWAVGETLPFAAAISFALA